LFLFAVVLLLKDCVQFSLLHFAESHTNIHTLFLLPLFSVCR
jgi:hypothetical protein